MIEPEEMVERLRRQVHVLTTENYELRLTVKILHEKVKELQAKLEVNERDRWVMPVELPDSTPPDVWVDEPSRRA